MVAATSCEDAVSSIACGSPTLKSSWQRLASFPCCLARVFIAGASAVLVSRKRILWAEATDSTSTNRSTSGSVKLMISILGRP